MTGSTPGKEFQIPPGGTQQDPPLDSGLERQNEPTYQDLSMERAASDDMVHGDDYSNWEAYRATSPIV
jgi:hypothetical protein